MAATTAGYWPASTLKWLHQHHDSRVPPPGTGVWIGGFNTSDIPASEQAACFYDAGREPAEQCATFTVGCVLFQVFATRPEGAHLMPDIDAWLAPKGQYARLLIQIAPSSTPIRWPPKAVFGPGDREALAGRLGRGLPPRP